MIGFPIALASAVLIALALVAGRSGGVPPALTELALAAALGCGVLLGIGARRFWRGPVAEAVMGSGGRYVLFIALVAFAVVEAHAVGAALADGAPAASLVMLALPVVLAAVALASAVRASRGGDPAPARTGVPEHTARSDLTPSDEMASEQMVNEQMVRDRTRSEQRTRGEER